MADIFDLFRKIETEKTPVSPPSFLIVGLGNPGRDYMNTRHNTGFRAVDYIAYKCGVTIDRAKFHALIAQTTISGKGILLMKPQTFMNASGQAVREAAAFYKLPPENIIVLCDDINLEVARLRIRRSGSDGGQKGVRDIIYQMGADTFPRIKIGVGMKPHPQMELADWVLSNYTKEENKLLDAQMPQIYAAVVDILNGDIDGAMGKYNGKLPKETSNT